jgi:flagellar basal body-associated protein FliL
MSKRDLKIILIAVLVTAILVGGEVFWWLTNP